MPLRPVEPAVSFASLEEATLKTWDEKKIFQRSIDEKDPEKTYVFYDGPPFATGLPHYGHLVASILKDIIPRYWTMKGFRVDRRWGWDCHGLPVENETQKDLGLENKQEIDRLGIASFNDACRKIVLRYTGEWQKTIRRLGRWVDFDRDYKTMDRDFMETVWWVFKQLWDRGLIYEGYRVQPVSPSLGTPLSNFEVAQGPQEKDPLTKKDGHRRRQDPSIVVRFALEDEDASVWAWTTTPWTLPSNLALAVHPDVTYARVRVLETGEIAYVEPGRLHDYEDRNRISETEELAQIKGSELVGRPYQPLFPYFEKYRTDGNGQRLAFRIVAADYVTTDSGTGIVHQAPAFGEDDYETGKREGLPMVNPLDLSGIFDDSVPDFAGMFVKDADRKIVEKLKTEGKLVDQDVIVHPYPHCYRTDQPLIYMAISTWFMKVEDMREDLVKMNSQIRWVPEYVGAARFGNWLEGARDWNLSRNRYWGTPLPVWRCDENPDDMVAVGSIEKLAELTGVSATSLEDLHREKIDDITFPSSKTEGGTMRRVPEVFDCWFESGSMPYAQNHYPFENKASVEANLPADFIAEGLDQTRGWFYTLTVLSTALFGRPAFQNVIVNGIVLAEDGEKMSKSKKNYPDPNEVLEELGADALRIYLINSPVVNAKDLRFTREGVREHIRSVMLPLWNAYSFLTRYADVDGWEPDGKAPSPAINELDGWILSRLQTLVGTVETRMASYELHRVVPELLAHIDELTNWYIRRSRRRFWKQGGAADADADKLNAYRTLHHVLLTLSRVLAPFLPFVSEEIYGNLSGGTRCDSVHLDSFPEAQEELLDEDLDRRMDLARRAVTLGRGLRARHNVKVRQPIPLITIVAPTEEDRKALDAVASIIAEELNVKAVEVSKEEADLVSYSARPNLKILGPKYGKQLATIRKEVASLSPEVLSDVLEGKGTESPGVEGLTYDTETLLVDRNSKEGVVVDTEDRVTVALDLTISDDLRSEGLARELINRIQTQRKDQELRLDDRITLSVHASGQAAEALEKHWALIQSEVLATNEAPDFSLEVSGGTRHTVEGESVDIAITTA